MGKGRRLGWLLRVNRLYATQSRYNRLRTFAAEFSRDGSCAATVGTFSRWETGASTVPYRAVRRYERVLNLPDYSLVSVIDTVSRYMSPTAGPAPLLERPEKPDAGQRIEELVDRARGNDLMSAHDWDELTNLLAREPGVILSPKKVWTELSERLLHETSVADGTLWMHRAEAFNRLIAHPAGQHAAISTADRRFYGALLASVRKLRHGHFTAAQLRKRVPVLLAEGRNNARLAASLLKTVPAAMRQRINERTWHIVTQKLERTATATNLVERVHNATIADLDQPGLRFRDPVLPRLIDELLCDPVFDVRLYAAFLLYATPYRQPLGRALGQELVAARHSGNTQLVVTLLEALRILGGPEERRHVERLLLAPSTPSGIRDTAASALGHIGGASREDYWTLALRTARQRWRQTPTGAEASVLYRLVYALGMADRRALLNAVTADATLPDRVRSAARWWITLPSHIRHSARM